MRIEIAIVILLLISFYNLLNPILNSYAIPDSTEQISLPSLPKDLTRDKLNKIVYKIKTEYNDSDWDGFYDVFGEYAKAQLSVEDLEPEFNKLKGAIGNIGTYTYSHYSYDGNTDNAEWFDIYYKCRFERGKGTIEISTRTLDEESGVIGVNITLDEL